MSHEEEPAVPDALERRLARSIWLSMARAFGDLAARVQSPDTGFVPPVDTDFVASHIVGLNLWSALDHARTLSRVLLEPELGPSSATLARGVVENVSRVFYIADGATEDEVRARALAVLLSDVQASALTSTFEGRRDQPPMSRDEYIDAIKERRRSLGVAGIDWKLSKAIEALASEQWQHFHPRVPYSTLSSMAHGHLPGLGALVVNNRLRLPKQEIINQVGIALGMADVAVHRLQRCPLPLLPENSVQDLWESRVQAVRPQLEALMAQDRGRPPVQVARPPGQGADPASLDGA